MNKKKTKDKIIFLDFDGVMNCSSTKDRITFPPWGAGFRGLDDDKVQLVSKLAEVTGAKVVISSTWRLHFKIDELREMLGKRGFKAEIIDETPHSHSERGEEIQDWIDLNGTPAAFVVLDDIRTQFVAAGVQCHSNDNDGFTQELFDQGVQILGEKK